MSNRIGNISNSRIENLIQLTIEGKLDTEAKEDIAAILSNVIKESKHFCKGCQKELPTESNFLDNPFCNPCIENRRLYEWEVYRQNYNKDTENNATLIFVASVIITLICFQLTKNTDSIILALMPVIILFSPFYFYRKIRNDLFKDKCIAHLNHYLPFHN